MTELLVNAIQYPDDLDGTQISHLIELISDNTWFYFDKHIILNNK